MKLLPKHAAISGGNILFEDKDILKLDEREMQHIRGSDISMVFQEPMTSLNPLIRVGEQIAESARFHLGLSKEVAKEMTLQILNDVGLPDPQGNVIRYPHELSGGMRQRIMIGMAMICNPKLLIADEPTTALDVTIQAQILDLMKKINRESETSIIFISHDLGVIKEICSKVVIMYAGHIVESADVQSIFSSPRHPYTYGLISSIPSPGLKGKTLYNIPGKVPSLTENKKGCPFYNRCFKVQDRCKVELPELKKIERDHNVRCFYPIIKD